MDETDAKFRKGQMVSFKSNPHESDKWLLTANYISYRVPAGTKGVVCEVMYDVGGDNEYESGWSYRVEFFSKKVSEPISHFVGQESIEQVRR